jgi:hypothetical protein
MARMTWLRGAVLALTCGILAATTVPQADAQSKDKIPVNPTLSVAPPEGAIVLFDGKAEQMRDNWYARRSTKPSRLDRGRKGRGHAQQARHQQQAGVRRLLPARGVLRAFEGHGNSGVGMQGRYEVQILNSYGKQPECHECGAFYSQTPPKVIASKPAGEWQTFDIFFRGAAVRRRRAAKWLRRPAPPSTRTAS